MSLDNIQLPPIVIHGLFKDSLIDLNTKQLAPDSANGGSFTYLGNNEKRIAFLVYDEEAIYLADHLLNFLMGILTACKLTMADVALINLAKTAPLRYEDIAAHTGAEKLVLFGKGPDALELPLSFPFYQVQQYNNQWYLCAPSLDILIADKTEKGKLWSCLKQLFALS